MGTTNMGVSLKGTEGSEVKNLKMAETWWEWVIEYGHHEYGGVVKGGGGSKVKFFKMPGNGSEYVLGTVESVPGRAAAFFWNLAAQRCPCPRTLPRAAKRPCFGIWPRSDARAPTHYPGPRSGRV